MGLTLAVLPILPMALPLLPLTLTDMAPLPQDPATVILPTTLHTLMVVVGVTMVGVAMAIPLLAAAVVEVTMDDIRSW